MYFNGRRLPTESRTMDAMYSIGLTGFSLEPCSWRSSIRRSMSEMGRCNLLIC